MNKLVEGTEDQECPVASERILDSTQSDVDQIMSIYSELALSRDTLRKIDPESNQTFSKRGGILSVPSSDLIADSIQQGKHFFRLKKKDGNVQGFLWGCYDFSKDEKFYTAFDREGSTTEEHKILKAYMDRGEVAYGMDLMVKPDFQGTILGLRLYHNYFSQLEEHEVRKMIFMAEEIDSVEKDGEHIAVGMKNEVTLKLHRFLNAKLVKVVNDSVDIDETLSVNRVCNYYMVDVRFARMVLGQKLRLLNTNNQPNKTLTEFRDRIVMLTSEDSPEDYVIKGIWNFDMRARPSPNERVFTESGCLAASPHGWGSSFSFGARECDVDTLVGQDGRFAFVDDVPVQIAILDACYASMLKAKQILSGTERIERVVEGDINSKAITRADIVSGEVDRLARLKGADTPTVLMIGVVQMIVESMKRRGLEVLCTDMDEALLETDIGVRHGSENLQLMQESDAILATGMVLATSTVDEIIQTARKLSVPLILFAQTGSNFAEEYIRLGVDTVISEKYPWYCMPGASNITIHRKPLSRH
ncbi:hypothetical protein KJ652_07345 [Patescibacteria group bacterium]|nr:hypothetical protein [Patescibacteria group bacterium]MBU1124363.1 hypothetical protein [Patescibacteria group bacterium]MBU1911132.1 hypothetical protein [Patescibacteria group bacterium]